MINRLEDLIIDGVSDGEVKMEDLCETHQAEITSAAEAVFQIFRPEVWAFAALMERKLRDQDDVKAGWKDCDPNFLWSKLEDYISKLDVELGAFEDNHETDQMLGLAVGLRAADVANMAMMIADVSGVLEKTTPDFVNYRRFWLDAAQARDEAGIVGLSPAEAITMLAKEAF